MAAEAEIERFLVRYVADTSDAKRGAQEMVSLTQQTTQEVQGLGEGGAGGMDRAGEGVRRATLKIRDLRRGLGLLSFTSIIPPEATAGVFKAVIGMQLASRAADVLSTSMGGVKAAFVATGIGVAVVALGELASWLIKTHAEANKARESAEGAFKEFASGAKTFQQALSGLKVSVLSEGIQEVAGAIANITNATSGWGAAWGGLKTMFTTNPIATLFGNNFEQDVQSIMSGVDNAFNRVVNRAVESRRILQQLMADPRIRQLSQQITLEQTSQAAKDSAKTMEDLASRTGMAETEAKKLELAQARAARTGMSLQQAMADLSEEFARMDRAQARISRGGLSGQVRDLNRELERAGLSDRMQQLVKTFQDLRAANPMLSMVQSLRQFGPQLEEMGRLFNEIDVEKFRSGLREQAEVFGLSAERAGLYRLRLQGVSAASLAAAEADVKQLEALRALTAEPGRAQAIRGGTAEAREAVERQRSQQVFMTQRDALQSSRRQEGFLQGILNVLRDRLRWNPGNPTAAQVAIQPANFEGV